VRHLSDPTRQNLVTISRDFEHTVDGTKSKIYVRLYVDALHSGLLADMGAERWHTLTALASFMDENGVCYPTQSKLAEKLGITRVAANRRIKKLLEYRWQGDPVVKVTKRRAGDQQFANNVYTVLPISRLAIF
jgi:biotin operon repressor